MADKLEKFIKEHRQELDSNVPNEGLWRKIEGDLNLGDKERKLPQATIYWRAAAIILFLITSWLVADRLTERGGGLQADETAHSNPELAEAEEYYVALIDQKRQELANVGMAHELGSDFKNEVDVLDSMYIALKKDLDAGNEEYLVDAMILNLQLRIEILNQQLQIIKKIEKSKTHEQVI